MKFVFGFLVAVVFISKSTLALECFECTGSSASGCFSKKVTCSGSCYYALAEAISYSSSKVFIRGCISLGNAKIDGCADAKITYSGGDNLTGSKVSMNQRMCYCTEDNCNDKSIYSVNPVVNKAIQCYECSGAECGSSSQTVFCNGACAIVQTYNGQFSKSCMNDNDIFGSGSSMGFDMKFTGCASTSFGGGKSEIYMCHDNLCNKQSPCKMTSGTLDASSGDSGFSSSGSPCVWIGTRLAIVIAIAAVLTI